MNNQTNPYQPTRPSPTVQIGPTKNTLIWGGLGIFLASFLAGIFFTVAMQNNSLQNTPLGIIQTPILSLSNIPTDAHKEWLALQQSFKLIDRYFYERDKINHKEMLYQAASGAVNALGDRFTAYNPPQIALANQEFITGKFVGIGVTPEIVQGHYLIKSVIDKGPASKGGIKPGDILVAVNGVKVIEPVTDAEGMSKQLRGAVGTKVKLTFQRPADSNRETEYELTREELIVPSADVRLIDNNIAYIEMNRVFGENTMKEFDEKITPLLKNNPSGYILDLRGNGGGSVETARQLIGRFLDGGVAYYEDSPTTNVNMREINAITNSDVKLYEKPMVILVDGNSASASEITAAAIQDRGRGILIGEKTYGKGSAQYVLPLEGNSALRVTVEHWFTPKKVNLYDSKGIKPDIEVIATDAQKKLGQDPQLERAIERIISGR